MKYLISCFYLLFFSFNLIAQVPGYQGKKFYVSYEPIPYFFSSELTEYPRSNFFDNKGRVKNKTLFVKLAHKGSLDYVIKRNMILTLDVTHRKDGFTGATSLNNVSLSEIDSLNYFKTKGQTLGIGFKYMNYRKKGFIAPVGNFVRAGLFVFNTSIAAYGTPNQITKKPTSQRDHKRELGMIIGWGMQTVWFERLVPSYSVNFSWRFGGLNSLLNKNIENSQLLERASEYAFGSTWANMIITGQVGIGVLLF